jgi:anaerobic dimethyl sulfoxide reductase subunit A
MLHGRGVAQRLLHMFGGCTELWSNISAEAEVFAVRATYGAQAEYKSAGREPTDYVNSRLILMWGWSPADGTFGTGTHQYLKLAKKHGVRIICVDPRRTRTSHEFADQHIFIRPSTDTAALIAMAYVITSEGLHDQAYLDRYVLGFDEAHLPAGAPAGSSYRTYLMGHVDGVRKTPEWAAEITGIPADTLRRLAVEFATSKPAALQTGYAPGRTIHGEQFHRAAYALAAMTGNVGIAGGNAGTSNGATGRGGIRLLPAGPNPAGARVASSLLADLLTRGQAGGYPADIKMIYSSAGDLFNQLPNVNKIVAAAERLEFMVVHDHFMTPTARYADIVLPATTFWERNDVHTPWAGAGHYVIFMQKAIEPMAECRNDLDICTELARRLGVSGYNDKTEEAWLRELTHGVIDDFETFPGHRAGPAAGSRRRRGVRPGDPGSRAAPVHDAVRQDRDLLDVAGRHPESLRPRRDPRPSRPGSPTPPPRRIRCAWSRRSRARGRTRSTPTSRFSAGRTGTTCGSPRRRAARGIADGQRVRVFNDRGATRLPVRVTDRIAPGVVSIKEGAWFTPMFPESTPRLRQVLTADASSPAGAIPFNTCFVDVRAETAERE